MEQPFIIAQTIIYAVITYWMIGFEADAAKVRAQREIAQISRPLRLCGGISSQASGVAQARNSCIIHTRTPSAFRASCLGKWGLPNEA